MVILFHGRSGGWEIEIWRPKCHDEMAWRHTEKRRDVTQHQRDPSLQSLNRTLVAKQLLGGYLWNRLVDFAHFRQKNLYDQLHYVWRESSTWDQCVSNGSILTCYLESIYVAMETNDLRSYSHPPSIFPPSLALVGPQTAEEKTVEHNANSNCSKIPRIKTVNLTVKEVLITCTSLSSPLELRTNARIQYTSWRKLRCH